MEFNTIEEAEEYYWSNIAKNNEDEVGLEVWLADIIIKEE